MSSPIEIMKNAYLEDYKGSLTELIAQSEMEAIQSTPQPEMDVASTPEQQQMGLTQGPPRPMAFPNAGGQNFNTMGMDYPIDINGYDNSGDLVQSYRGVEPGIDNLPMGEEVNTVIENPTEYRFGGEVKNASKDLSLSQKIERYKKNRYK